MTRWALAKRNEAIGLAMALGAEEASQRTGVPRRTISYWLTSPQTSEVVSVAEAVTKREAVSRLWSTLTKGMAEADRLIDDPKTPARDKALLLAWARDTFQLWSGQATVRTENANLNLNASSLTWEEQHDLAAWLDQLKAEHPDEWAAVEAELNGASDGQ